MALTLTFPMAIFYGLEKVVIIYQVTAIIYGIVFDVIFTLTRPFAVSFVMSLAMSFALPLETFP